MAQSRYVYRERRTIHVPDFMAVAGDYPNMTVTRQLAIRTFLCVPLLRDGEAIGALYLRRLHVEPFTDQQIALVETFADQAVIAIENARLFTELNESNATLKEALEQQTATSDILRVIASSPSDLDRVLDVVAESAARLCTADDSILWRSAGGGSG